MILHQSDLDTMITLLVYYWNYYLLKSTSVLKSA